MSESTIPFTPGSGLNLRAILRTVGLNSVLDEVIELSDQSGVLITPLAERDLITDAGLGSGLKGIPAIGWDSVLLAASALQLVNGQLYVNVAGGSISVANTVTENLGTTVSINQLITAAGNTATLSNVSGLVGIPGVEITGTWTGTLVFEAQAGNQATGGWYAVNAKNTATGAWVASTTANGFFQFPHVAGAVQWRVRASLWTSGTARNDFVSYPLSQTNPLWTAKTNTGGLPPETLSIGGTDGTNLRNIVVKNANPLTTDYGAHIRTLFQQLPGSALPSHAALIGGSDGLNIQSLLTDSSGRLDISDRESRLLGRENGTVSTGDSSTALLGIGGVFTGAYENVKDYGAITISVFADQASAANGLEFDWSHDGVNTDSSSTTNVAASAGRAFSISPRARFFRVVYTNGAVAQGVFRLGVVYHPTGSGLISRPYSQNLDQDNYAQQVRAVLDGFDGTLFRHVGATLGQPLATDYGAVTRGLIYRNPLTGLYYAESGNITVLATAHTALQGFIWLVNTSSTIKAYIRSIGFVWSGTAATAFPTSPRITVERVTFTGTPSGPTITPAKRASADAANTATLRTASTGLTLTAGAVIESFVVGSILTAVGAVSVPEESWQPTDDDALIVLGQNEGIVIRQPDAGTAADTRKIVMTLSWEER